MKPLHIAMLIGLTIIWGFNFVVIVFGLQHLPPIFFATLRFLCVGLGICVLPRPNLRWRALVAIAMTLFVGQFAFLLPGMKIGFPPGLASLTLQVQAFFTTIIAVVFLAERPRWNNWLGMAIAFGGLAVIASTVGTGGVTMAGFVLMMLSALSWGTGNVLLKANPAGDMLALNCWLGAIATPPLLALSLLLEGPEADWAAIVGFDWRALLSLAYIVIPTTLLGYWIWGAMLKRYPAAMVAPFTLLVPVTGALSSFLVLGETFSATRFVGMAFIMTGLAVHVFGARWVSRSR